MNPRLLHLLASLLAAIAGPFLHGQTAPADTPQRTFRLVSIVGRYDGLLYATGSGASPRPVVIGPFLSPHLTAPANSQVEIYRMVPPPPDAPSGTSPIRQIVFKTTLPPTGNESIVVVRPLVPKDKNTLFDAQVIAIPENYQAGTCLLVNFTPFLNVACSVKDQIYTLAAGEIRLVPINQGITSMKIAVKAGENWALAGADAWRISPKHRGYILVFPYMEDPDESPLSSPPPAWARVNFEIPPQPRAPH